MSTCRRADAAALPDAQIANQRGAGQVLLLDNRLDPTQCAGAQTGDLP
jgi:hypothetical protein